MYWYMHMCSNQEPVICRYHPHNSPERRKNSERRPGTCVGVVAMSGHGKRGPQYVVGLGVAAALWAALYFELIVQLTPAVRDVVVALPCYALISFGAWSLACISYNLLTFRSCPEAAAELQQEIGAARADLKRRGLDVDG